MDECGVCGGDALRPEAHAWWCAQVTRWLTGLDEDTAPRWVNMTEYALRYAG